ncbi:MAG TPA: ArsR family transcriptional regulator [Holosporales bacterium]|nr:ArsR family transcriptional regulator [Holosporales bacterium]
MTIETDQIDLKILVELQKNSSLSNKELAELVGISAPSCLRRTKELQKNGFLLGCHAKVNPALLNLDLTIYCNVVLEHNTYDSMSHFTESMNTIPCVRECHMVTGTFDFLLKIIVPDIKAYTNFVTNNLVSTKNISKIISLMLVQTTKNEPGIPLELLIV